MSGPEPDEPNYFVLIAPGADSNDPTPAWVDVSTDLRSVSIQRGADKHLDEDQPGTATIVLDNFDGAYDNDNSGSPYAGQLVADMRVRVLAEWEGELYERFNGYLDDIDLDYPEGDAEAWATLRCTDALKVLAGAMLPSSVYVAEVLADNPVALWRLNETEGSTVARDSIGVLDLDVFGTPGFGEDSLIAREPGDAVAITNQNTQAIWKNNAPLPVTGPPITLELIHRKVVGGPDGLWVGVTTQPLTQGALWLQAAGTIVAMQAVNGANAQLLATSTGVNLDDGLVHHIVGLWDSSGPLKIYVDGVDRTNGAPSLANVPFSATNAIVHAAGTPPGISGLPDHGTSQMVAIYNTALSATRIAAHAAAVATPWNNDTPGQRTHRILDVIGWPALLRDIDDGESTLQSAELDQTALEHLLKVWASEFGELHVSKEGAVIGRGRRSLINRDQLAEFGPDAAEVRYRAVRFSSGADLVRNPVTVSRAEGVAQTVEAPATYYPHQFTLDGLLHDSDALSLSAAEFLLSEFKDQKRRVNGLTFGPFEGDRLFDWFPLLLEAELGDVYLATFRPPNGDDLVQLAVLEGTVESWSADSGVGEIAWSLSRAYAGSFWQLGVRGRSELGLTTRLYF